MWLLWLCTYTTECNAICTQWKIFKKKDLYNLAQKSKNSKNIYILTKELLLRCSLYCFALTQLILMPSVHSGRISEIEHFYSISQNDQTERFIWATTFSNSISNHRSVLGQFMDFLYLIFYYLFRQLILNCEKSCFKI